MAGETFGAWEEYRYVTGKAGGKPGRDNGREGWELGRFLKVANDYILTQAEKLLMAEEEAQSHLLTWLEVVAIRLYTGPSYVPINTFLGEISQMGHEWRAKASHLFQLTYSATVHQLTSGLRKLIRVNTDFSTVFRTMRGELPDSFWLPDEFGDVTATDFGFLSSSRQQDICVELMQPKTHNLLWEFRCQQETAVGFHSGADVSMLSQQPNDHEMVFPPLTTLKVSVTEVTEATGHAESRKAILARADHLHQAIVHSAEQAMSDRGLVTYSRIVVEPTFV
jgi:hypothetical protein